MPGCQACPGTHRARLNDAHGLSPRIAGERDSILTCLTGYSLRFRQTHRILQREAGRCNSWFLAGAWNYRERYVPVRILLYCAILSGALKRTAARDEAVVGQDGVRGLAGMIIRIRIRGVANPRWRSISGVPHQAPGRQLTAEAVRADEETSLPLCGEVPPLSPETAAAWCALLERRRDSLRRLTRQDDGQTVAALAAVLDDIKIRLQLEPPACGVSLGLGSEDGTPRWSRLRLILGFLKYDLVVNGSDVRELISRLIAVWLPQTPGTQEDESRVLRMLVGEEDAETMRMPDAGRVTLERLVFSGGDPWVAGPLDEPHPDGDSWRTPWPVPAGDEPPLPREAVAGVLRPEQVWGLGRAMVRWGAIGGIVLLGGIAVMESRVRWQAPATTEQPTVPPRADVAPASGISPGPAPESAASLPPPVWQPSQESPHKSGAVGKVALVGLERFLLRHADPAAAQRPAQPPAAERSPAAAQAQAPAAHKHTAPAGTSAPQARSETSPSGRAPAGKDSRTPVFPDERLNALVQRFIDTYEQGDLESLLALFAADARTNDQVGRRGIARDYQELFAATARRSFALRELRWQKRADVAAGQGVFDIEIAPKWRPRAVQVQGRLRMEVVRRDGRLLISKLFHEYRQ